MDSSWQRSVRRLMAFLNENVATGRTFKNQAEFDAIATEVNSEITEAVKNGLKDDELVSFIRDIKGNSDDSHIRFLKEMVFSYVQSHEKRRGSGVERIN